MRKINPYFYIIQHTQSKIKYAGCRYASTGCNPEELLQTGGYYTSSKVIQKIISKEGTSAFQILKILTQSNIRDLGFTNVREYEKKFLIENNAKNSLEWFNQSNSGSPEKNYDKLPFRFRTNIQISITQDNCLCCPIDSIAAEDFIYVKTVKSGVDIFSLTVSNKNHKIRINRNNKNYTWDSRIPAPPGSSIGYHVSESHRRSMSNNGKKGTHQKGAKMTEKSKAAMKKNHWSKTGIITHPLLGIGHSQYTKEKIAYDKNNKFFKVKSPTSEIFYVCSLVDFGRRRKISSSILRFYLNEPVPEPKFPSKRNTLQRLNTSGWSAFEIFGSFSDFLRYQKSHPS